MQVTTETIIRLMSEKFDADISVFSTSFLESVIKNRMNLSETNVLPGYLQKLISDPVEQEMLINSLSNSYSTFFRNPLTFALLYQVILPKIIGEKAKNNDSEIRIWSAGCAAGQEPYSLAIMIDDLLKKNSTAIRHQIFATDNSASELLKARAGIYDYDAVKSIPYNFIKNYFSKTGNTFSIIEKIKSKVELSDYDLLNNLSSAPPVSIYGDFDLVMCSNVLFYYKPEVQKSILEKFRKTIRKGGIFVTGEAETSILNSAGGFRSLFPEAPIYIRS
jgi:chemotaxis methyl-accepting protein methylase